jgi:NitT/TauT family transport system substrate-binding protein
MTEYIPEIVFTALIVDRRWAEKNRAAVVAFLRSLIQATAWMDAQANDPPLLALMAEVIHADGKYGRLSLDYMREKRVFPRDLSIPDSAFAKTVELMQKAGFPAAEAARAKAALDDSYRKEAAS